MFDVLIAIDEKEETPIYQQICHGIREAILSGKLQPGAPLPSARVLARKLGVSRFTIHHSLELLGAQGYIETVGGKGVVAGAPAGSAAAPVADAVVEVGGPQVALTDVAGRAQATQEVKLLPALQYHATSAELLPFKTWRQLLLKHLRREDLVSLGKQLEAPGLPALREAIAGYLQRSRSVACTAQQVMVFAGPTAVMDFIGRLLVRPGDTVAVENPGFRIARRIFTVHGAKVVPVDVDANGMVVSQLAEMDPPPKLVYVNPSAQDPTGAVLPLRRRQELIEWCRQNDAIIIEDDFGREYRYATRPVPSLQGLASGANVLYISSFWNVLFPLTRTGFAIVPPHLLPAAQPLRNFIERDVPVLEQCALADFISQGHLERYVRRMRTVYLKRRQSLIRALISQFGREVAITQESAAMHVVVRFKHPVDAAAVQAAADAAGLPMASTEPYYLRNPVAGEFIISFAQLDEQAIEDGVKAWRRTFPAGALSQTV